MSPSVTYIPIRDDHDGIKSMSTNERSFIQEVALAGHALRCDGRARHEVRKQQLTLLRGDNFATATVQLGHSYVTASLRADLIPPPNPDRPTEGVVAIAVDLSPSASPSFKHATPATSGGQSGGINQKTSPPDDHQKLLSNRILRCLERLLLTGTGSCIDAEALCVTPEYWVWKLHLHIVVVDATGGNLLDASVLASMAAMRHYRLPHTESREGTGASSPPTLLSADVKEPVPLPLHHTPLCLSFALMTGDLDSGGRSKRRSVAALADPDSREELVATGFFTISLNIHGEVCWMDFGGGCELEQDDLRECWKRADPIVRQMCESLEATLSQADQQALQDRLDRLKGLKDTAVPTTSDSVPFYQSGNPDDDYMQVERVSEQDRQQAQDVQEEAHRKNALDYNVGHMPTKVRDDDQKQRRGQSSALLVAMLQSVQQQQESGSDVATVPAPPPSPAAVVPPPPQTATTTVTTIKTDNDDDEEEAPVMLQNEFAAAQPDEDDVDNLAAAIKSKKKKKSKK